MNKKGEFMWGVFAFALVCALIVGLIILVISISTIETQEKYDNLCEKKGMEYFDFHDGSWGLDGIVICLDNDGEQHEVQLK